MLGTLSANVHSSIHVFIKKKIVKWSLGACATSGIKNQKIPMAAAVIVSTTWPLDPPATVVDSSHSWACATLCFSSQRLCLVLWKLAQPMPKAAWMCQTLNAVRATCSQQGPG